jgi:hypothetical protein
MYSSINRRLENGRHHGAQRPSFERFHHFPQTHERAAQLGGVVGVALRQPFHHFLQRLSGGTQLVAKTTQIIRGTVAVVAQ